MTGGGLVAVLHPEEGPVGLWRGEAALSGGLRLRADGHFLRAAEGVVAGPGSWWRSLALPGGGRIVERGLLPDVGTGLVVHWSLPDPLEGQPVHLSIEVELAPGSGGAPLRTTLSLEPDRPAAVAVVPPGVDPDRFLQLVRPLEARRRERLERSDRLGAHPFRIRKEGADAPARGDLTSSALRALEEAPLEMDGDGTPRPPFLAGIREGRPRYLSAGALAELGLGALAAGRAPLALAALRELAEGPDHSAFLPLLHLAARWGLWTGRTEELLTLREPLDRSVARALEAHERERATGGAGGAGAAFPSLDRTLEGLARAVEPLGEDAWLESLRGAARAAREGRSSGAGRLPVVGQPAVEGSPTWDPVLPPPEAFGSPDQPASAPRRTLLAARLLRAWVEGALGARPDASYGRLRIAPDIRKGVDRLEAKGILLGDAPVALACRLEGTRYTFVLRQEGGRVPVNLVFEPHLPFRKMEAVLVDDEPAEVETVETERGTEIRCQLPLDGERRVTVAGRA